MDRQLIGYALMAIIVGAPICYLLFKRWQITSAEFHIRKILANHIKNGDEPWEAREKLRKHFKDKGLPRNVKYLVWLRSEYGSTDSMAVRDVIKDISGKHFGTSPTPLHERKSTV